MSYQKVEAGRGLAWITEGVQLLMKNPGVLLVMAFLLGLFQAIPLLNFLMIIVGPALVGGYLYALRETDQGGTAQIGQLFLAFQQPGKAGPMLALCIPWIVGVVLMIVCMFLFGGAAMMAMFAGGASQSAGGMAAGMAGMFVGLVIVLAIIFVISALLFFAIPRVMFDNVEPFAAMKESLSAVLANIGPLLLYGVILLVGFFVLGLLIAWIPFLGMIVIMTLYYGVSSAAVYLAYRDVFGTSAVAAEMPPAPPV